MPRRLDPPSFTDNGPTAGNIAIIAGPFGANMVQLYGRNFPVMLEGKITGLKPGQHVRVDRMEGWWVRPEGLRQGPRFKAVEANGHPPAAAVRAAAGLPVATADAPTWTLVGSENSNILDRAANDKSWRLRGIAQATVLRGTVLGELPLRVGATLEVGSSSTRIKSVREVDGNLSVLLEERDSWGRDAGQYSNSYDPALHRVRPAADGFVVLNRAKKIELMPVVQELGTMKVASIMVGRRNLVITPPDAGEDWLEGAVLVKVRFVPESEITQALSGEPVMLGP